MNKINSTESEVYGKLTVLSLDPDRKSYRIVKCECGTVKSVRISDMKRGSTVSCGCWRRKIIAIQYTKMGLGPKKKVKLQGTYSVRNPIKSRLVSELEKLLKQEGL